ncbi:hypothetical protein ACPPVS_12525 [Cellulomonas sp. McL0617]|uniref:hypothetical protein n=1 Tax=Cellulomonas sp. McL0617 TaxID=3415675 RepID=UPI003CECFBC6
MYPDLTAPNAAAQLAERLRETDRARPASSPGNNGIASRVVPVLARTLAGFRGPRPPSPIR